MIYENVSTLQIHKLTQEQYDRELAAGRLDENAIYLTPDEEIDLSGYATEEYVNAATRDLKNEILDGAGEAYDTLKELADLINANQGTIDTLEEIATSKADKEHTHEIEEVNGLQDELTGLQDGVTSIQEELENIQTELSGKAEAEHTHEITDVTGLKDVLDGKAAVSHGLHVEFSDVAPQMAGEAFAGVATTVARSDHRHATDTTRASHDDLLNAVNRIQNVETKQDNFLEVSEEDILSMFK
jgi:uncharacterized phage infection (PIP) family protein YhgE